MQIIGDPIGAVEVKVLTSQTHTYKLGRFCSGRENRRQALAFCIFLSVKTGLDVICSYSCALGDATAGLLCN